MHLTRRKFGLGVLGVLAPRGEAEPVPSIATVSGPILPEELGVTLVHEHIIADLRPFHERRRGDYRRDQAIETCLPRLEELRRAGCQSLVEPSPLFVRRDTEALRILAEESELNIICSTGIYGAAEGRFIPDYARSESAERLAERYVREIEEGIEETAIYPGFIKSGVNASTPLPAIERKLVRAAALAQRATGLPLGIHSGPAAPVLEVLDILDEVGVPLSRFVWIHAQAEKDRDAVHRIARRGVWVSYDGINPGDADSLEWILEGVKAMEAEGFVDRTLISQDAGWFQPGQQDQSGVRGYTGILTGFLPKLREAGFGQATIDQLLIHNPRRMLTPG